MSRSCQVRVAIADQHTLFTDCLGVVLEMRSYHYKVVPVPRAGQRGRVLSQLLAARPDVVLINADLGPYCNAVALIEPLVRAGVAVVVTTETADEASWGQCLAHGARAVVPKSVSLTSMVSVVRRVSQGQPVLDRAERDRLIAVHRRQDSKLRESRGRLDSLSAQEGQILRHLMAGRTVREIAARRVVSEATVRTQVKAILGKLELSSQLAAVAAAHDGGWSAQPLPIAG